MNVTAVDVTLRNQDEQGIMRPTQLGLDLSATVTWANCTLLR